MKSIHKDPSALPSDSASRTRAAWCEGAIEVLVAALLSLMPFALGVVAPWSEAAVAGVVALVAGCLAVRAWLLRGQGGQEGVFSWAMVPVGLFLAVAAAQLVPLPASLVGALSPHTLETRRRLLQDLPDAAVLLARIPLSFYPAATCHDLRVVLACTVMFLATVSVYRREERQRRLLWVIVLSGGAAAVLALLQDLSGTDKVYWRIPSPRGAANSGPFIAYSNYSQYINLCIGAALGLLLYAVRRETVGFADRWSARRRSASRDTFHGSSGGGSSRGSRQGSRRRSREASDDGTAGPKSSWHAEGLKSWRAALLIAVMIAGCVTLFLSLSRGGMLALLGAAAVTWVMLARRRGMGGVGWLLTLVLLAVFAVLLYAGSDAVFDRLATLKSARDPSAGRFQTYKDILLAWRKFPLFGTGLGTHEYVYPMFDRSSDPALADFADSDYFQMLEEMGAVGLGLVLAFAGFVVAWYLRAVRRGGSRIGVLAYGLGFGLAAVMLQSFTDFGQHLPSIGCISAVYCGLLFNLGARAGRERHGRYQAGAEGDAGAAGESASSDALNGEPPRTPAPFRPALPWARPAGAGRFAGVALPVLLAAAAAWALRGAEAARQGRAASDRAAALAEPLEAREWRGGGGEFRALLREAEAAVSANPSDVKARYQLACYRWHFACGSAPSNGAAGAEGAAPAADLEESRRVVAELNAARAACPTYGPAYAVAGQIERMVLGLPVGSAHVQTAYELAPANPEVCLAAAQLDAAEGRFDESVRKARRCVAIDQAFSRQVFDLYLQGVERPDLAVEAVAQDPVKLFELYYELRDTDARTERAAEPAGAGPAQGSAEVSADGPSEGPSGGPGEPSETAAAMAAIRTRLRAAVGRPDAPAWTLAALGGVLLEEKECNDSIIYFRRALQRDYGQADWHFGLASALAAAGQDAEAIHEAETCLHLQPQMGLARELILSINTRPRSAAGAGSAGAPGAAGARRPEGPAESAAGALPVDE